MARKDLKVEDILRIKGRKVITTTPRSTIAEAARVLAERRVGILVVSDSGGRLEGVISERDVVRGVGDHGARAPVMAVAELMTRSVVVCGPEAHPDEVLKTMNERGFRHMPVVEAGRVIGLVSIGDLHKHLLEQLALDEEAIQRADDEGMPLVGEEG